MTHFPTDNRLLAPRFLFRFSVPVMFHEPLWSDEGAALNEAYRLPNPAELDNEKALADVRMAWHEQGIALCVRVEGKRQPLWCRESRLEDSDGVQVWIDTRATHTIHRASRFCHRFAFLPAGGGRNGDRPHADQLLLHRARENARAIRPRELEVRSEIWTDGYQLEGMIPAAALTGFDPIEHSRLGFTYAVSDRDLGLQTFSVGTEFPYEEDPSVWATLELVRDQA